MPTINLTGELGVGGSLNQGLMHFHLEGGLGVQGQIYETLRQHIVGGVALEGSVTPKVNKYSLQGGLALLGGIFSVLGPTIKLTGGLALEGTVNPKGVNTVGTSQGINTSTATGVIPQIGSAIYSRWSPQRLREFTVQRHWDFHESGRVNFDATRAAWDMTVDCNHLQMQQQWDFYLNRRGSGEAFYFYDLQANGFQYDPTGVLTSGRYKVRYATEFVVTEYQLGTRFRIQYSLIEVE